MASGESPIGSGGRSYQWIRSNILGLVAIFIALSGTAVATQVASHPGAQTAAKKKKAKPGPAGPAGPAGPQGPQGPTGPSTGPAGGSLTGSYPDPTIALNAVGAPEIANPVRTINLPVTTFINWTDNALLDFTVSDGTSPDLIRPGNQTAIQWDADTDGGGANIADTDLVETNFTVPDDYAASGHFRLVVYRAASTGVPERLRCAASVSGDIGAFFNLTLTTFGSDDPELLVPVPGSPYATGAAASLICNVDNGSGGTSANDAVELYGAQFRYIAAQ